MQADNTASDVIFANHVDGNCINIGTFYIRPTPTTLKWFHHFLEWYYRHPYEVDQRGLDAMTYAHSKLAVLFSIKDTVFFLHGFCVLCI